MTAATGAPAIDLAVVGADEAAWFDVAATLPCWRPPGADRRVVVVAPHPDDETLGVGGTIASVAALGAEVTVVCVTDGEAAPSALAPGPLAELRRVELDRAVGRLTPTAALVRLGLPDGGLAAVADVLADRLAAIIRPDDVVLATLDGDGHPDHDVTGAAARLAAVMRGAELWWYPVWAWHWHDPQHSAITGGRRIDLAPEARRAKAAAAAEYVSQLDGPAAVVPATHLRRCLRPFEVLIAP